MSKDKKGFDLEDRLIDFAVRIIRTAGWEICGTLLTRLNNPLLFLDTDYTDVRKIRIRGLED